jgi:hypothetical protein
MWMIATLTALTLTLFIFNFANTVRWQIRAQNAADSAAASLLAKDAQAANSLTTLMYALDLQDFKLSTINNTVTSLLTNNTVCLLNAPCSANLTTLVDDYTKYLEEMPQILSSVTTFTSGLRQVGGAPTITDQLNLQANSNRGAFATGFLNSLLPSTGSGGACVDVSTDCGFQYSVAVVTSVPLVVDVVACRNVPTLAAQFLNLTNSTFKVVGRSTVQLAPLSSTLNVGSLVSGLGNANVNELIPLGVGVDAINLASLNLTTGMLVPEPVSPLTAANVPC